MRSQIIILSIAVVMICAISSILFNHLDTRIEALETQIEVKK